ncbi:MAG TPA: ADP-ribosylglycohydrolase family protein [Candidatus Eisenbacteria bacterium]|nr:ADP-ribosylglycohydrolase family protein [Candidatus Eisenbacteria bacterium]
MSTTRDRYRGALLGLAVGNALGLPVEFWPSAEIRRRYPDGVREIDAAELRLPWDDDLAQAAILAEAILEHDTLRHDDLARRLLEWDESNGRGMGNQTRAVINALRQGIAPSEAARLVWERDGGNPAGNGAVMRCAPVALRWRADRARLLDETEHSVQVTHYDPRCAWSAYAVNLAVAAALDGRTASLEEIALALEHVNASPNTVIAVRSASGRRLEHLSLDGSAIGFTLKTMQAGLWCLENAASFEESLVEVVRAGGDTDTNGAVAGAVLGALLGAGAIPERWTAKIRRRDHLVALADGLLERSVAPSGSDGGSSRTRAAGR